MFIIEKKSLFYFKIDFINYKSESKTTTTKTLEQNAHSIFDIRIKTNKQSIYIRIRRLQSK